MFLYLRNIKSDLKIGNHSPGASQNVACYKITKAERLITYFLTWQLWHYFNFLGLFGFSVETFSFWRLNKHLKFYAIGFVHLQSKCITKEKFKYLSKRWKSPVGGVWFYTDDAVTQIHRMKWQQEHPTITMQWSSMSFLLSNVLYPWVGQNLLWYVLSILKGLTVTHTLHSSNQLLLHVLLNMRDFVG